MPPQTQISRQPVSKSVARPTHLGLQAFLGGGISSLAAKFAWIRIRPTWPFKKPPSPRLRLWPTEHFEIWMGRLPKIGIRDTDLPKIWSLVKIQILVWICISPSLGNSNLLKAQKKRIWTLRRRSLYLPFTQTPTQLSYIILVTRDMTPPGIQIFWVIRIIDQ